MEVVFLIEHPFVEGFDVFAVHIGKSKFIPGDEADWTVSEDIYKPIRQLQAGVGSDIVGKVGVHDLHLGNVSSLEGQECEGAEKAAIRSFFVPVLEEEDVITGLRFSE